MKYIQKIAFGGMLGALLVGPWGCFNPSYTEGGFLCKEGVPGTCPSGMTCCSGTCRTQCSGRDATIDRRRDLAADQKPRVDVKLDRNTADMGPKTYCATFGTKHYQEVTSEAMMGAYRFDMDLDTSGVASEEPAMLFADYTSKYNSTRLKPVTGWHKPITLPTVQGNIIAGAFDRNGKMVAIFAARGSGRSGDPEVLWTALKKVDGVGVPSAWETAELIDMNLSPSSLDVIPGEGTLSEPALYFSVSGQSADGKGQKRTLMGLLKGRISASTPGFDPYFFCDDLGESSTSTTFFSHPRLTYFTVSKTQWLALSIYTTPSSKWLLGRFDVTGDPATFVCPTSWTTINGPGIPALLGTAMGKGSMHGVGPGSVVNNVVGTSPSHHIWDMTKVTSIQFSALGNVAVDAVSLDMTRDPKRDYPCFTIFAKEKDLTATKDIMALRAYCYNGANWMRTEVIDTLPFTVTDAGYGGFSTRVRVDKNGNLHIGYQTATKANDNKGSLRYALCQNPAY